MNKWSSIIQYWLYPATCLLCGDPGIRPLDICQGCLESLPFLTTCCPVCGEPQASSDQVYRTCNQCLTSPPPFDRTLVPFHYEGSVRHLVKQLKFGHNLACARLLGTLLATEVKRAELPELIIPVPLHPLRYRERGFNQAEEIARVVSEQLEIPMDSTCCQRILATRPQSDLSASQRQQNMKNAFRSKLPEGVTRVAIVDDVVTTAHTVRQLASALRRAGAEQVEVWACARA